MVKIEWLDCGKYQKEDTYTDGVAIDMEDWGVWVMDKDNHSLAGYNKHYVGKIIIRN